MNNQTIFKENQGFLSNWMLIGLLVVALIFFLYHGMAVEWSTEGVTAMLLFLGLMLFLLSIKLKTAIDETGIHVDFKPFVWNKTWRWDEIETITVKKYSLWDYGGWGYRIGKDGIGYIVKGSYGLHIRLKNGRKIMVGTQYPDELHNALKNRITDDNI